MWLCNLAAFNSSKSRTLWKTDRSSLILLQYFGFVLIYMCIYIIIFFHLFESRCYRINAAATEV